MKHSPDAIVIPAEPFGDDLVDLLIAEHITHVRPALQRLWDYYRNPLDFDDPDDHRAYSAAQQAGLPDRITRSSTRDAVVENDIAWRVHTLVDFMFGRPVKIESLAVDPERAALIGRVLESVIAANGGPCFYHDLALLGGVYGFVDLLLRTDRLPSPSGETAKGRSRGETERGSSADWVPSKPHDSERILQLAQQLVIETVEAPRAIPVPDPGDYRKLHGYIVHYTKLTHRVDHESFLARLVDRSGHHRGRQATVDVTEVWTDRSVRTYHDGELVGESANRIGRLPVVHVQNLPQPFFYEGLSEVEPLIPLQDELNIRLTDRANRVTMQSFKMYLGKGIEQFIERPVSPGQMWQTDNPDASIDEFGGDSNSPSETAHIDEIRQAMDKTSGVTPVAAGILGGRIGNLSSGNALRVTLMGLLAKTQRKRVTYGKAIEQLCELVLHTLDVTGVMRTTPDERRVKLHWPSPLPENELEQLNIAKLKRELGVPAATVLAELGYSDDCDTHPEHEGATHE